MSKIKFIKNVFWVFMILVVFSACKDYLDEHYEVPEWLKGSAWEVLESRGNYQVFLEGAELAGFKPILEGKSLVTVMAPNDSVFSVYFSENGKSSIEDYTTEELKKLIGFHIMYYSYDEDKLINFRPLEGDGAAEDEKLESAGLYYKHRTRSYDAPSAALDSNGVEVTVYHNERLLPVFSHEIFETKGIDANYNYEYFYSNSEWTGSDGFNVSNASVDEYSVVADNGYLYLVNQVVEPLETIYNELKKRSDYSRFLELYDRYSYFELDEQLTTDFGNGTDLYLQYHSPLPDIANEWPIGDYRSISLLSSMSYSVFAPSNSALDQFFEHYWKPGGYTSLADVNEVALVYLLYNSVYGSSVVFPEEITNGDILNSFDMQIDFDVDAVPVENRVMCENGALYGLDQLDEPGMFNSVTGPAFRYKDYYYYLYMLDASRLLVGLSSNDATLTELIPSNEQMTGGGISLIDGMLWSDYDGDLSAMGSSAMTSIVDLHTVTGGEGIKSSGTQVLRTNTAYTYWYVKDGKLTTSVLFNKKFDNPSSTVSFVSLNEFSSDGGSWSNGRAYSYDSDVIFLPLSSTASVQNRLAITRDETYPYFRFSELLREAGLVDATNGTLTFLMGMRCTIFIPQNELLDQAIADGSVPGVAADGSVTDQDLLANYMKGYFVSSEANGMTTYPYIGSGINGEYTSLEIYEVNGSGAFANILIEDNGESLTIQRNRPGLDEGNKINVISDFDYFPFAFEDGGVHYINGVL